MKPAHQFLLAATFIPWCWLAMMAVHEAGHVAASLATGGTVRRVVLHPLALSQTELADNPCPLLTAWSGPLLGTLVPLAALAICTAARLRWAYLVRFFAGFCLITNGVYLGAGATANMGDARDLLQHGSSFWSLFAFALLTIPAGFYLWHRLGPRWGLAGEAARPVDAYAASFLLALTILLELLLDAR